MQGLSSSNRGALLALARGAIRHHLETGSPPAFETQDPQLTAARGCFVTLYDGGALRGCVGTFDDREMLYRNALRMAIASATQDTRFPPVTKEELARIRIEISVLDKPEKIHSVEELVIGKHGVLVRHGPRTGTYLPHVAEDEGWEAAEFIARCAREKAGLSPDECAAAEVYRFAVERFAEAAHER